MSKRKKALTLIELLLAVILIGMLVVSFVGIQRFAFHHAIASSRRADLQNEAFYVIEHLTKSLGTASGYLGCPAVRVQTTASHYMLRIYQCLSSPAVEQFNYGQPLSSGCLNCIQFLNKVDETVWENLTTKALPQPYGISFLPINNNTSVMVNLTLRHNPALEAGEDNPEVKLSTIIDIPQASGR